MCSAKLLLLIADAAAVTLACRSVLHIHTIVEECEVTKLVHAVDMKTKEPKKVSRLQVYVTTYVTLTMLTCYFDHGSGVQLGLLQLPPTGYPFCSLNSHVSYALLSVAAFMRCVGQVCQVRRHVRVPHHNREAGVH
jgi:hypothetical protein